MGVDPDKGRGKQCLSTKNPINLATGNKYQIEADYEGQGASTLKFHRAYNSVSPSWETNSKNLVANNLPLGNGWQSNYELSVKVNSNLMITTATIRRADGKYYFFNLINNAWVPDADITDKLTKLTDSTGTLIGWRNVTENDEVELYNADGKLLSIAARNGRTQTLTYADGTTGVNGGFVSDASGNPTATVLPVGVLLRVTDSTGRALAFAYDASSRIVKMTTPLGAAYLYTYDIQNNIASVTYPDGKIKTYLYGEPANVSPTPSAGVSYTHALTGIIDENNVRYGTYRYDASGRAYDEDHASKDHYNITYTMNPVSTTVTDPLGSTRTYNFTTVLGVMRITGQSQPGGSGCGPASSNLSYDPNGNITSRTDFNGITTTYTYDLARNLELSRTEAFGTPEARTITTLWHPTYRLPVMVTEPLRSTNYTYDAQGNLLTLAILPMGGTSGPRITNYTYNPFGQVLSVDGPRQDAADITNYSYDPQGNLISVTNALNQVTTLGGYDANGRVGTITNPNGLVTALNYDPRGRLTSRLAGNEFTHYTYDGVGNLTNVALPNGALYTYTYDQAHRLIQIADLFNNRIVYTLDNAGNRIREETFDTNGTLIQTHSRAFDALNRLWQDIGAVNQTTTYTYDPNGNVTSIMDPLNRLSTNVYDALNRLSQVSNPDNGFIHYDYDAQNQLTAVTDPRNLITQYTRDGLGNLNQTLSPDTGSTNATYDPAGNLITKTDAKGQFSSYTYDPLNRLIAINYSGGTTQPINVNYLYDQGPYGIGHLSGIADHTGVTQYSYDQNGRLIAETRQSITGPGNAPAYTTAYNYDPMGRLNTTTYPSGRTVNYSYDPMGRISNISTTDTNSNTTVIASNIQYRPFGGVLSYTYGNGQIAQPQNTPPQYAYRQYDQDGRIASYLLNGQPNIIGYDAASQISFINNMGGPSTPPSFASYSYDPMSRLTSYTQGNLNQSYNYDPVGNRTSQLIGSTPTNYGYDGMSNKLTFIQSGAGAPQLVTQDAIGATTSDAAHQYAYDVRGRLVQATTAQGQINYEVNALGLRVRKQVPYANSDTQYHYDSQGHLIGENQTDSPQFSREYIWLGDIPVAVMQ